MLGVWGAYTAVLRKLNPEGVRNAMLSDRVLKQQGRFE